MMSDALGTLTPQGLAAIAERVKSEEFDTLAAGYLIRQALGMPLGGHRMSQGVTSEDRLSPEQVLALTALLEGKTNAEAAQRAGVARETVSRWFARDAAFVACYRNRKAEIMQKAAGELSCLVHDAINAMRELVGQRNDPGIRLKAAMRILEWNNVTRPDEYPVDVSAEDIETDWKIARQDEKLRQLIASIGE
jgi:hypothetical protein